ncbi:hypothetical protein NX801_27965 [Streptomyces sp. LP05-1]|uniref:Uncharacterized protein n=1 Tax=Streptomyces pyxinae TaxID=2970734 RepID=A0ABT2CPM2_9ACTN|nr:hypothetical protein [Streptomyces sp. LP05-1]MCS0639402.1 hypothetical protein [Streptomyces sp. LP05-1]
MSENGSGGNDPAGAAELRIRLRELAEPAAGGGGTGPPGVAAVLARGRRVRRRRRLLGGAAVAALLLGAPAVGHWAGAAAPAAPTTAHRPAERGASFSAPSSPGPRDVRSSVGRYPPQPPSKAGEPLDGGPRKPVERVRYRYDLAPAACGLRYVVFGGRVWESDAPSPPADRSGDRLHGFLRWSRGAGGGSAPDTAVFEGASDAEPSFTYQAYRGARPACLAREPERRHSDAPAAVAAPAEPVRGVRYAYDRPAACSPAYLFFGGRLWRAAGEPDRPGPAARPGGPDRAARPDGLPSAGYLTLVSDDTVRFEPVRSGTGSPGTPEEPGAAHHYHPEETKQGGCS